MQAASGAGRGVPQFPTDIVTLLLRHIEQNQRLSSCALVSSSWQQVTNAVSSHVSCKLGTAEGYSSLSAWLSSNCSTTQINSIEVDSTLPQYRTPPNEAHVLQLPLQSLSKLQALKLLLCQLQATRQVSAAAADRVEAEAEVVPASLAALTALTQLDLKSCTLDLSELGSCTNLRHLNLKDCLHTAAAVVHPETPSRLEAAPEAAEDTFGTMLAAALPQLQQLTHLTLQQWINGPQLCLPATFEGFRDLQQLQELRLQQGCRITSSSSLRFPPSLTLLQLNSPPEMSANNPTLTQLSNLQHLGIFDGRGFDPVLLRSYPKLQHLQLDSTEIADTAVAELLSALAQLKHLQHLNLWDTLKVDIVEAEPYAALTASSQLTYLDLYESFFAPGAAKFIFAADRPCKGLIEVSTGAELFYAPGSFDRLASCCPALQRLELCHGTDESPEIDLQVRLQTCKGLAAAAQQVPVLVVDKWRCVDACSACTC